LQIGVEEDVCCTYVCGFQGFCYFLRRMEEVAFYVLDQGSLVCWEERYHFSWGRTAGDGVDQRWGVLRRTLIV